MNVGVEWLADAEGCSPEKLRSLAAVQAVCDAIIADLDLHVIGQPVWHQFPDPGGVTGLFLLTESHLACHTYPETGIATFNLYCCRTRPDWTWEDRLSTLLGAARVTVKIVTRGASTDKDEHKKPEVRSQKVVDDHSDYYRSALIEK